MRPIIDLEKCTGCGNCVEICPGEVYQLEKDGSSPIRAQDCIECWACVNQCPKGSINLQDD